MFVIAVIAKIARNWKQSRCPNIGEWLKKSWYINVIEYYCVVRKCHEYRETWNL